MMRDRYQDAKVDEQKRKIQRENAKHATRVERRKIRRQPLRAQKNAGNKETGEHEEQIDSAPPYVK
jgi:TolA-binding protein